MTRLARFDAPTDVQGALQERFGVEASRSQIVFYNPETSEGAKRLSDKWKELFKETRKKYSQDTSGIAAAQKAERVRMLEEAALEAKKMKNYPLMASMLEQIAKEVGGKYTNKELLEVTGKDGGPVQHQWGPPRETGENNQ